ncbi:LacI family DNA-binding transcriptional regulator [Alloscardovia criceti]|uniref:LacI family DNA-binding transcriptional regulator n=1 Tax=Alloscardovia criceti TaxID=356828 RepID=UPI00036C47B7|nr:LacI family DNA-binding transcriptional regulator [Alloscardovia criceti]
MAKKKVTITQVAQEAGVSIKTVSNVLNNTGNMREETRQRVRAVITRMGYQVNLAARSMRTGATKLIGLGIADFSQPFNPYLADSIIQAARQRGYGVIISTYGFHHQDVESIIDQTHQLPADGWIFFTGEELTKGSVIFQQSYPVVLASDFTAFNLVDSVTMAGYEAVRDAVHGLIEQGKKRIAFAGAVHRKAHEDDQDYLQRIQQAQYGTVSVRTKAYCDTLRLSGRDIDIHYLLSSPMLDHKSGVEVVGKILDNVNRGLAPLPDAIMCANDALAFGVIHELAAHDIRIPQDVEIIGFDNVPEAQYSNPTLTTIDPHVDDYARKAVDYLIERIEGYQGEPRRFVSGYEIQRRQSSR